MNKKKLLALLLSATISACAIFSTGTATAADFGRTDIVALTTNYLTDPVGLPQDNIRFSWQMDSTLIGQGQAGYQIRVFKGALNGELMWDSGKVADDKSVSISYTGPPLELETRYYWTVEVTDLKGKAVLSEPAYFETGCDWGNAEWITAASQDSSAPLFRMEKPLFGTVASAKLYITSLGIYDAYINGKEVKRIQSDGTVTDDTFNPGWTDYNSYVNYQTYDVTDYVSGDAVALGVMLGKGWYAGRIGETGQYKQAIGHPDLSELSLYAKMLITYDDGREEVIVTNGTDWKSSGQSPVTTNDYFDGSSYDGEIAEQIFGWNNTGYNDSSWDAVSVLDYSGDVKPNISASARIAEELDVRPVGGEDCFLYSDAETELPADQGGSSEYAYGNVVKHPVDVNGNLSLKAGETLILDLGQNMVGVARIKASGSEGTTLSMRHAEMLNDGRKNEKVETGGSDGPKGTIYTKSLKGALVNDTYTFGSSGSCDWTPPFTFHGFRYLEITATGDVTIESVSGQVITSTGEQTGFLETSNADVNQLVSNTLWSQRGNYLSIPTDCPQRSERAGWTGDAQLFSQTALYNFDTFPFLENYTEIMNDHNQNNGGAYQSIMPTGYVGFLASLVASGWSDAGIVIPWTLYHQTGDTSLIRDYYDEMDAYMDLVGEQGYNTGKFGDWLSFQGTSNSFLNTCYRAYTAQLMAEMGGVIGDQEAVDKYNALFEETKQAFLEKYVEEDGTVLTASADNFTVTAHGYPTADNAQTGLLWTLKLGFYENEAQKQTMAGNLIANIKNEGLSIRSDYGENTLAVGFLGVNVILPVLSDIGEGDMAYTLLLQDDMPSWLYSVKNGATTIWERWNSYSNEDSFGDSGMNSFNHYSYGAVLEWMYEYMAGIKSSPENPGFKEIVLQPSIPSENAIDFANGRYDSYYGTIESNWKASGGKLTSYEAVLPANTSATLYLPVSADQAGSFRNIDGVTFEGMTQHNGRTAAQFALQSGSYRFTLSENGLTVSVQDSFQSDSASDKTILRTVLTYAEKQFADPSFSSVIEDVQASFSAALENARAVDADLSAEQSAVDSAWHTLMNEIHKLGFVQGDKTSLGQLVDTAAGFEADLALYTPATAAPFTAALTAARAVLSDGNAMQGDVAAASETLLDAMLGLRYKADKSILEGLLAQAESIDLTAYSTEQAAAFRSAKAEAERVYDDINAQQLDADKAAADLKAAIEALTAPANPGTGSATAIEGDASSTTTGSSPKTGDTTAATMACAVLLLAGAAVVTARKRRS